MKLITYDTDREGTTEITKKFSDGVNLAGTDYVSEFRSIQDYKDNGIPDDADAVASLGILRGTGLMFKEAAERNIDRFYIDHAYFDPGYKGMCWLRIVKNHHTMNWLGDAGKGRWKTNFAPSRSIQPWRTAESRGDYIYVLPPTHAIQWYFNAFDWTKQTVSRIKQYLPEKDHWRVVVRLKPKEPIVDENGNLIRVQMNDVQGSLKDVFRTANCIVAYNSVVALDATLAGVPVITSNHNCCYPVSFSLDDFADGVKPPQFDQEPVNRTRLLHWLSNCQYNITEIQNGFAFRNLIGNQNV